MSKNVSYKGPSPDEQPHVTDSYFKKTRKIILENGDVEVTYAVFMRRPVTYAGGLAVSWLKDMAIYRNAQIEVGLLRRWTSPACDDRVCDAQLAGQLGLQRRAARHAQRPDLQRRLSCAFRRV